MSAGISPGRRLPRRVYGAAALLAIFAVGVLWQRPWAGSVMTATVSLSTDENGPVSVRRARSLFSDKGDDRPLSRVELDVGECAGQLVRLEVDGNVTRRLEPTGSTGSVACAAELVDGSGARPLEFAGWYRGSEINLHTGPAGPHGLDAGRDGNSRFAIAATGTLWHVFRAAPGARVRVLLKPVLARELPGRPVPLAPGNLAVQSRHARQAARRKQRPPDVFIYLIDALRADHLGCYGYGRETSPFIDSFAAHCTLYENAQTGATWTRPSVATLLSGLHATVHGAMHTCDGLAEWPVLLPEMVHRAGYVTRCITANVSATAKCGFDQGYDEFIYLRFAPASWINMMVGKRLRAEDPAQPVFMYLHIMEPHGPYTPRPESFALFDRGFEGRCDGSSDGLNALSYLYPDLSEVDVEHLLDLYDAEVYEADQAFAEFIEILKRFGRYENSIVVLVSDHGEAFGEHDTRAHGFDLNQETMHVALLVKFANGECAGVRVERRVSLADVLPTLLAEVGLSLELPYPLPGGDLRQAAMVPGSKNRLPVYSEVARLDSNAVDLAAVIDEDGYKRVIDLSVVPRNIATRRSVGLWDTHSDPKEEVDLAGRLPVRAAYGEQLIARWLLTQRQWRDQVAPRPPPIVELPAELKEDMEALGYLGADRDR